ncbi:MAG: hypothetical protein ACRCZY_07435 [Phocaeicola sp.]
MELEKDKFILQFESGCKSYANDIIMRICKRAIRELNKQESTLAGSSDDYPDSFKFFDILSIERQDRSYEEINPFIEDYIEATLDNEYDKIQGLERLALDYSECYINSECDYEQVRQNIREQFQDLLNKHYSTNKIQKYLDRL